MIANKPKTFIYEGKEHVGIPQEGWPYEKSLAWLQGRDLSPSSHVYVNIAKLYGTTVDALIQDARAQRPQDIPTTLPPNLTPNTSHGPLSVAQRQEIYDHHSDVRTSTLAYLYGTNPQNIRLAKQKRAEDSTPGRKRGPETLTLTPFTPSAEYGPLTLAQKQEIYDNHAHITALTALANTYMTSVYHVRQAQQGKFDRKYDSDAVAMCRAAALIGVEEEALVALMPPGIRKAYLEGRDA